MSKKDYTSLAEEILEIVGGKENITAFVHCITRLRFEVKDRSRIKNDALKNIKGTMGAQWAGDQLQIIIGSDVESVYNTICKISGIEPEDEIDIDVDDEIKSETVTIKDRITTLFKPIVDCIIPLMGLFVATGLIKGVLSALTVFELISTTSGTYLILYALSDTLLYFFPIFIGFNCGKVFKTNAFITAAIGATLIYPTIITTQTAGTPIDFMGIPVTLISYVSSILPVIIASYFASKLEKFMSKYSPAAIKFMLVPSVTLLIIVPLTFLLIGPIMSFISDGIGSIITTVWNTAPILGGLLIGSVWQILVMTGLHAGTAPFIIGLFAQYGYDLLGVCVTSSMIALAGTALAMVVRSRQTTQKEIASSALLSCFLGVTEPALYGVALPHGKALLCAMIGGGLGGMVGAVANVKCYGFGGNGLLQLPFTISLDGMMNTYLWCLAIAVAFLSSFLLAYVFCKKDFEKEV